MIGRRAKKEKSEVQQVVLQSDFNELEIQVLKRVASKMSKGMTENAPDPAPVQSQLNTVKKEKPSKGLNSLGGQNKQQPKQQVKKQPKQEPVPPKKKRKLKSQRKAKLTQSQDKLAQKSDNEEIGFMERFKGKSLEEANEIVAQRHRRPIPKVKIDQDAVNSYYTQKVAIADTKMSDYGKLMKMAALSKAQQKG